MKLHYVKVLLLLGMVFASVGLSKAGDIVYAPDKTVSSANGTFSITFGERRERLDEDFDYSIGDWVTVYGERASKMDPSSGYYQNFVSSVVSAFNTMENTFANKSSRTINVQIIFEVDADRTSGAAADPWWQDNNNNGGLLTYGDLGQIGVDANTVARVNKVEYLWKYGMTDNYAQGAYDVQITFRSQSVFQNGTFGLFYVGADTSGYKNGMLDVETITLHEMGHALGFHTGYGKEKKSMMDLMTQSQPSSLEGGGLEWIFTGETATAVNGGKEIQLMPGDPTYDPHVRAQEGMLMQDGTQNPGTLRGFSEKDLAMLQDLGWTLTNPIVVPAAPEPTTATLSLLALAGMAARRRRRE